MHLNFEHNRKDGIIVPARSNNSIELEANIFRDLFCLEDRPYFPVIQALELLREVYPGADFEVMFESEMGDDHGRTFPDQKLIWVREDVYERADSGEARDRFTICHEIGHLLMHQNIALSRVDPRSPPKVYRNSEWQADKFASYLLMPKKILSQYSDINKVMIDFGTSFQAANARRSDMKKS